MQQQRQYVGIDLHLRRSVIVRMTEDGGVLECVRIVDDSVALSGGVGEGRTGPGGRFGGLLRLVLGGGPVGG